MLCAHTAHPSSTKDHIQQTSGSILDASGPREIKNMPRCSGLGVLCVCLFRQETCFARGDRATTSHTQRRNQYVGSVLRNITRWRSGCCCCYYYLWGWDHCRPGKKVPVGRGSRERWWRMNRRRLWASLPAEDAPCAAVQAPSTTCLIIKRKVIFDQNCNLLMFSTARVSATDWEQQQQQQQRKEKKKKEKRKRIQSKRATNKPFDCSEIGQEMEDSFFFLFLIFVKRSRQPKMGDGEWSNQRSTRRLDAWKDWRACRGDEKCISPRRTDGV